MTKMSSDMYHEGYWERGEGSNYVNYGFDSGWLQTCAVLRIFLDEGSRIFEVGAAKGWFIATAMVAGYDCRGMDISQYAVEHQCPGIEGRLTQGNAAVDWIEPTDWYDAVVSWEFLEHVPFDELDAVLENMQRAGRPGSLQIHRIGCDIGDESDHHHHDDVTHQPAQTYRWWSKLLAARGWEPAPEVVSMLDALFAGRDWAGRFFAHRLPA